MIEHMRSTSRRFAAAAAALALSGCAQHSILPLSTEPLPSLVATPSGSPAPAELRAACDFLKDPNLGATTPPPPIPSVLAISVNRAWMDRSGAQVLENMVTTREVESVGQIKALEAVPHNNDPDFDKDAATLTLATRQKVLSNLASAILNTDPNPNTAIESYQTARNALAELYGGETPDITDDLRRIMNDLGNADREQQLATQYNLAAEGHLDTLRQAADSIQNDVCTHAS